MEYTTSDLEKICEMPYDLINKLGILESLKVAESAKNTILHVAVFKENVELVRYLAEFMDVNRENTQKMTPFNIAIYKKNPVIVKILLETNKVNINKPFIIPNNIDTNRGTALHYLFYETVTPQDKEKIIDITKQLINHNIDLNYPMFDGSTALTYAAYEDNLSELIIDMINAGSNLFGYCKGTDTLTSGVYKSNKNKQIIDNYITKYLNDNSEFFNVAFKTSKEEKEKILETIRNPTPVHIDWGKYTFPQLDLIENFAKALISSADDKSTDKPIETAKTD